MSRSNSPGQPAGPLPGQRWPAAEQDPPARRPAQPRWPLPQNYDAHGQPLPADPHAGYHAQPTHADPVHVAPPSYAPQFGHYVPPARPPQPAPYPEAYPTEPLQYGRDTGYADAAGYAPAALGGPPAAANRNYRPSPGFPPPDPAYDQTGYEPWPAQPDPRGYDLATFSGPAARPSGGGNLDFGAPQRPSDQLEWGQQGNLPGGYPAEGGYGYREQAFAHDAGGAREADIAYEDPGEETEADEGRGGRRGLMIVGVLVGAIALGGGLAYAYKQFGGGKAGARTPVVTADKSPAKTKPVDAGGKEFAHADKKFMERLDETRNAQASQLPSTQAERLSETDENGARKVKTLVIGRDGSVAAPLIVPQAPAAMQPLPLRPSQPAVGVPGLVLDGGATPRPPSVPQPAIEARPAEVPAARSPLPPKAAVIAKAVPVAPAAAPPVPRKKPLVRDDAVASALPATGPAPAPAIKPSAVGAGGFVAVLSSQKSRMDALKAFADLQQKYGGVLQGKTPDVQEANLGEKGLWFRAVVGPPGSREAASGLCSQLKSAGYSGCWVATY